MIRIASLRPLALAIVGAAVLTISAAMPGSAHFGVSATTTAAGSYAVLTFSTGHGCEGSAWNKVSIQIPEGITTVRPGMKAGWTIETEAAQTSATPVPGEESHAAPISVITYTASAETTVPDGFYDEFKVQVQLPETVGETIYFPLVQTCEVGENPWIEIPAAGEDGEELAYPAPAITITEATEAAH